MSASTPVPGKYSLIPPSPSHEAAGTTGNLESLIQIFDLRGISSAGLPSSALSQQSVQNRSKTDPQSAVQDLRSRSDSIDMLCLTR